MRTFVWLILGLTFACAADRRALAADSPRAIGTTATYETLGKLPVMHAGRIKPLDTLAREEIKQIFGRETIKLRDAQQKVSETWGPVAALFDWSVRPDFWDDQPIILVEYLPLKRKLLSHDPRAAVVAKFAKMVPWSVDEATSAQLKDLLRSHPEIQAKDRAAIESLATDLAEDHKWLAPRQLEDARVRVEGQTLAFDAWFKDLAQRNRKAEGSMNGAGKLSNLEKRAIEVGTRLVHYQSLRDRNVRSVEPLFVMPRPNNAAYLAFSAAAIKKGRDLGPEAMTTLEIDAANALATLWNDIPIDDRALPGTDPKFDERFTSWLADKSQWVPLRLMLESKAEELAQAGYPRRPVDAFRASFRAMEQAEGTSPGHAPEADAARLISSARELGQSVNSRGKFSYPAPSLIDLETYFNETNPFFKAPGPYALAMILLAISLGFVGDRRTLFGRVGQGFYSLGMVAFAVGIALEVLGFSMRVRISGWAPVTNMYETVIWVALIAAVLGLVFELIFRKTYTALAASGVALLGTVLAANVPLLDPNIHGLQPVLRSNYWLTIHVLTEVSSYAAFALAMGLGLIATFYYLTATYRRSPSFRELAAPLVPGLPMLGAGTVGLLASYGLMGSRWGVGEPGFYLASIMAGLGGVFTIMAVASVLGEAVSRAFFRDDDEHAELAVTQAQPAPPLIHPTADEIRAREDANPRRLKARERAMQSTAAKIKPLANFIYRTMQVGVLLIAAGTILGGVWADYSWGRFWGWDPKETWALITLLVYLIPLHGRFAGWVNTFGLVMASVVCFLSVVMAWYGVNFVLGVGLHSYGFTEGGGQGIVSAVVMAVLALPASAAWRRALAYRVPAATS